mmetsp:Transcript_3198/g.11580  ORF Transcript_3198/g.11580 Transcript_3198/m.11580 type:complete len:446 (-) Transcript_3198:73-1410(-)
MTVRAHWLPREQTRIALWVLVCLAALARPNHSGRALLVNPDSHEEYPEDRTGALRSLKQVPLGNGTKLERMQQLEQRIRLRGGHIKHVAGRLNYSVEAVHKLLTKGKLPPVRRSLVVVSIGSDDRPWFLSMQMSTFGSHPLVTAFEGFTESSFEGCQTPLMCPMWPHHVCPQKRRCEEAVPLNPAASRPHLVCDDPRNKEANAIARKDCRSEGWWCAQRRPLQAIKMAGQKHRNADFFLVIDDDTYVRMDKLRTILMGLDPDELLMIGRVVQQAKPFLRVASEYIHSIVLGGSGYLMSRATVDRLLKTTHDGDTHIDACVRKTQGGEWCWWHSDWAVSQCVADTGTPVEGNFSDSAQPFAITGDQNPVDWNSLFMQNCVDGDIRTMTINPFSACIATGKTIEECGSVRDWHNRPVESKEWLTCHYVSPHRAVYLFGQESRGSCSG